MSWTVAQKKVIDTRNKNLLVSAAAGSGKTAVLVERIISMISDGEKPIDIDHLLVVTFTNAAAAEMRERIGLAIDEKLKKEPDNLHLQKQSSLLQSAQITTIHSFCLNIIRNYFHRIDLDPSFKIAEESEITLLKSDVIADLLEGWYEEGREDFHEFIESYSYSKSDLPIEDLILQLFNFSMSNPWPEEWLTSRYKIFELKDMQDLINAPWMKDLIAYIDVVLKDLLAKNGKAIAICNEPGGPTAYLPALMSDRSTLEQLINVNSYEELSKLLSTIAFDRLSAKKEEGVEQYKKDAVKGLREEVKKGIKDLAGQFFFQSPEEMLKDMQSVGKVMRVLFELTLEFMEAFAKKKEEKNLIDFNDLEHFALKILVEKTEEGVQATEAALEVSDQYDEILIDEYQDSNMVQETILRTISREDRGRPNRFMVGDVKQSIYKFRLAMPEIFMEKYGSYSSEELTASGDFNLYQKIELDRNFRSRKTVLDYVNRIFEQIMQRPMGGIVYDEAASLKYGELFEETLKIEQIEKIKSEFNNFESRIATEVELLLVTDEEPERREEANNYDEAGKDGKPKEAVVSDDSTDADEEVYTKKEIEARAIAKKIKELTDPDHGMLVFDKKLRGHRPATYRDIVILLRSMTNWSEVFVNTLMQEGIPAYADTGTGYFQTLEIMTVLNMLRIIDNPRQDIPLTAVLYSPIVGLTTTELAMIRAASRNVSMYSALINYMETDDKDDLGQKLAEFMKLLGEFRAMVKHKPIHELIQTVLDRTGYYYYVIALPGGEQRKANIDMLISQAVRFEKGSYSGLFHFIRYIEKLHKYEIDFGEASTSGEQDNTVRIMSIHKSKGLEFPLVFVAGMSKQFNTQDLKSSIVLHSELGVGPEFINSKLRMKAPTLLKKAIQKKLQVENLGEELRVLYVAMTRAREKLILSGYIKDPGQIRGSDFSFYELLSAKSCMDWVLPATVNRIGWNPNTRQADSRKKDAISIKLVYKDELREEEMVKQLFMQGDREELLSLQGDVVYHKELREEVKRRFNFVYPYQKEAGLKVKMTVSELKKLGQFQDEELSVNLYQELKPEDDIERSNSESLKRPDDKSEELNPTVPGFILKEDKVLSGTDRGTLYHKVLELIRLENVNSREDLSLELERIVRDGRMKSSDIEKLKLDYIYEFTTSEVAGRMKRAEANHKLFKEKQFVMGLKASEVLESTDSNELILIQGIIDVFFEEEDGLVLLDYKSDLVKDEKVLVERYKVQIEYYRKALEQMLGKKVKEMILYSLPLGKEIRIEH